MQKNHLDVDVFSIFVEKVFQKVRNRLIGDVSANHDVPVQKIFGHLQIQDLPEQSYNEGATCKKRSGTDIDYRKKNLAYLTFVKEKILVNVEPGET